VVVPVRVAASGGLQITSQPPLYPGFNTNINYYVTRCGNNPIQLTVTVPAGTFVSVDAQPTQSGTTFSTEVAVTDGQEFLIDWATNNVTQSYHVRCLPTDFPDWTSTQSAGQAQTAYFVVTPDNHLDTTLPPPYVAVFDTNGVPRWWFKEGPQPIDAKTLASGNLVWTQAGAGTPYEEHSLDGSLLRTYSPSNDAPTDLHELQVLPNGNYFIATDTQRTIDTSICGGSTSTTVTDPVIQELNTSGTLLWSWDTADHIPMGEVSPNWYPMCSSGDPYHFNSIEPDSDGNIIVSFRHLDAIYKISVGDGSILWKVGGTQTSASLSIVGDADCPSSGCQDFGGQHDARIFIDATSGQTFITLHDNGTDRNRPPRSLRFRIDTTGGTATLDEVVADPNITQSLCCGSARKLTGGDWLVSWGANPTIEELQPSGVSGAVFSLTFNGVFSYRAQPVTSTGYGDALTGGMNAQYPRVAQDGGPPSNIPDAPASSLLVFAGLGGGTCAIVVRRRCRRSQNPHVDMPGPSQFQGMNPETPAAN